jgi:ActR/RegA family two-component response regulator
MRISLTKNLLAIDDDEVVMRELGRMMEMEIFETVQFLSTV